MTASSPPTSRLGTVERVGIALLLIIIVAFTSYIFYRSAFRARRMGDAGVYFRAAWAVRADKDLYSITDNNGWSYTYPPPFAVAMAPFADAPAGEPRPWMMPYEVSLAIWLSLQWVFAGVAAHWIAKAIEKTTPLHTSLPGSRRWWQARLHPSLIALVGIGATVGRAQVNLLLLMMLAGMILSLVRGRGFIAGLWLAAAASLKVIPGFLVLYALYRRNWKMLAGCAAGGLLFMFILPAIAVGPRGAVELNRKFLDSMIVARFGESENTAKVTEHNRAVDNQAIMAASYNIRNPGAVQRDAEVRPDSMDRALHWGAAALICIVTVGVVWVRDRRGMERKRTDVLFASLLMVAMVAISPMSHLHFFALAVPLIAVLLVQAKERGGPTWMFWAAAGVYFVANLLPHAVPMLKYLGLAGAANLALWGAGVREALRKPTVVAG